MLGEEFHLSPTIVDRLDHKTTTFAYLSLKYDGIHFDPLDRKFTFVGPSLIGLDRFTKSNSLHIKGINIQDNYTVILELFFDKNEAGYRDGYRALEIHLVSCRLGFFYSNDTEKCECIESNDNGNLFCPNTSIACVRYGYWFGQTHNNYSLNVCERDQCNYTSHKCPTSPCPNAPGYCTLCSTPNNSDAICVEGKGRDPVLPLQRELCFHFQLTKVCLKSYVLPQVHCFDHSWCPFLLALYGCSFLLCAKHELERWYRLRLWDCLLLQCSLHTHWQCNLHQWVC